MKQIQIFPRNSFDDLFRFLLVTIDGKSIQAGCKTCRKTRTPFGKRVMGILFVLLGFDNLSSSFNTEVVIVFDFWFSLTKCNVEISSDNINGCFTDNCFNLLFLKLNCCFGSINLTIPINIFHGIFCSRVRIQRSEEDVCCLFQLLSALCWNSLIG